MMWRSCFQIVTIILCVNVIRCEMTFVHYATMRSPDYTLAASQIRFARLRCLQQYPGADTITYSDSHETHCYLQCYLYKTGLMDLNTRGLDSSKFLDIWDDIEKGFDDKCMNQFLFDEALSGKCSDYYRKLMEFREHCVKLFEYTFGVRAARISSNSTSSKSVGESASEFCDSIDSSDARINAEDSESQDVSFLSQYKKRLQCLFENIHYLDAYGRVDESELLLSYQEDNSDTAEARAAINHCSHRANAQYRQDSSGDLVLELQTCLKKTSPEYWQIFQIRDDISRRY